MTVQPTSFEHAYQQTYRARTDTTRRAPWDIGRAQPAVTALAEEGAFTGSVLDIGCGLGENSMHLAGRGLTVTGIDSAPSAVRTATERAEARDVRVDFAVADATSLTGYENRFDTILDSGLYHCLGADDRRAYIAALARVAKPGARLHVLSFTDKLATRLPTSVSEANLRENFTAPWTIETLTTVRYETALTLEQLQTSMQGTTEDGPVEATPSNGVESDENGTVWFTAWHLTARLT